MDVLEPPDFSVVVITRNEERHIAACLESVSKAMRGRRYELIVADANSTDATAEIVGRHPATLVRLGAGARPTPAAGRHVGFALARGRLVLFLDGDSVLDAGWVDAALVALEDPRLAGVAGIRESVFRPLSGAVTRRPFPQDTTGEPELPFLGGSAVYRASVLRAVGGWNPFLFACEEAELGARLRARGYLLRRLPVRMTEHLTESRAETLSELWRRVRRGYPYGMGQLVRHGLTNRTLRRDQLAAVVRPLAAVLALGCAAAGLVLWLRAGRPGLALGWLGAATFTFAAFCLRAGGVRRPAYYAIEWPLTGLMILRGLLMRPRSPEEYPPPLLVDLSPAAPARVHGATTSTSTSVGAASSDELGPS